jgi:hypothetical protein
MAKVEGSNPFIRFAEIPRQSVGFLRSWIDDAASQSAAGTIRGYRSQIVLHTSHDVGSQSDLPLRRRAGAKRRGPDSGERTAAAQSGDLIRERMNALPFVVQGHITLQYDEVYEI